MTQAAEEPAVELKEEAQPVALARIRESAAAELRELAADVLSIRTLVVGLLRVAQDPRGAGLPLGPDEGVYYRKIGTGNRVVLYTVAEDGAVVIEGFRQAATL